MVRKTVYRLTRVILVCICINSCTSDYTEELSGNYFYLDEGPNSKEIRSHLPNKIGIYANVIDYDYNRNFIVAMQHPDSVGFIKAIAFGLRDNLKKFPTNSKDEHIQSEKEADSILNHDPYYISIFAHKINYWIIAHKNKRVYGPLTKEEYLNKRRVLNIPKSLDVEFDNLSGFSL